MYKNVKELEDLYFAGCDSCSDCCNGKRFSFLPLVIHDFVEIFQFFPIMFGIINDELRALAVLSNNGGQCRYLNSDGKCDIYDSKPPSCSMYPVSPYYNDFYVDMSCPGVNHTSGILLCSYEKIGASFQNRRSDDFTAKYAETKKFLASIYSELVHAGVVTGVELFTYHGAKRNSYINAHLTSLKHFKSTKTEVHYADEYRSQKNLFSDAIYG